MEEPNLKQAFCSTRHDRSLYMDMRHQYDTKWTYDYAANPKQTRYKDIQYEDECMNLPIYNIKTIIIRSCSIIGLFRYISLKSFIFRDLPPKSYICQSTPSNYLVKGNYTSNCHCLIIKRNSPRFSVKGEHIFTKKLNRPPSLIFSF